MNPADLLDYLQDLAAHNERDWFQAHKATYDDLRADFQQAVAAWLRALAQDDPALADLVPAKTIFRIYRDVRFSKNKDPYKAHFSAYFAPGGNRRSASAKQSTRPGRYVQLSPQGLLVAGGLYEPSKEQLAAVRQEIDYDPDRLHTLLAAPGARRYFPGGLAGEQLKKVPPGYEATHPQAPWLRHKQFLLLHELPAAELRRLQPAEAQAHTLAALRALAPFCEWLAVNESEM